MRGQQYSRSSNFRSNSTLLTGPHLVPSYNRFKVPTFVTQEAVARCTIKTNATSSKSDTRHPRVFGVSDCHTDYLENWAWAESLDKQDFRNDVLLLAGDVCDELTLLEDTLTLLKSRFGSVFYCPGNHCLWIRSTDESSNSFEKLQRILSLCTNLGVHTTPQRIDNVWIAPIQSWHHKSFDTDPEIPDIPAASAMTIADYAACSWPDDFLPPGSQRHGSLELAQWFDSLNDGPVWDLMLETRHECDVISFSHFLPHISLMPEKRFLFYPNLVKASGSLPLAQRLEALQPDIHLFGHTHFAWDSEIHGTRYVQAPLGAPLERHRRLRTLCFNAFMTEDRNVDSNTNSKSSSVWTAAIGDPVEAKWLPVELFQFNTTNIQDLSVSCQSPAGNIDASVSPSECQHRGPNEPLRDAFTTANEATHGILVDSASDDDPLTLITEQGSAIEEKNEVNNLIEQRKRLKHGTMPGPLGAHWSDYYATNPRTPEIMTLAPWVAHLYQKRRRRREKDENENMTPTSKAAIIVD